MAPEQTVNVCLGAIFVSDGALLWYTKSNIHFSKLNGFN